VREAVETIVSIRWLESRSILAMLSEALVYHMMSFL